MIKTLVSALAAFFISSHAAGTIRMQLEQAPDTIHPRFSLDAIGQRTASLLFRGLTVLDAALEPRPSLAESWSASADGKTMTFVLKRHLKDQAGVPIRAVDVAQCLENYRVGTPLSPHVGAFPLWTGTRASGESVVVSLKAPDPYFARNISLLLFYRVGGETCPTRSDQPGQWIGSGPYQLKPFSLNPKTTMVLEPHEVGFKRLELQIAREEVTRAMMLLKGESDIAYNAISLAKTRWIANEHADRFHVIEQEGTTVSYLAFNLSDPYLKHLKVRQAVARALDREAFVRYRMFAFGRVASSLIHPSLKDSRLAPAGELGFDPEAARKLLDEAGFKTGKNGERFKLKYRCTSVREGVETAMWVKDALKAVGITVDIDVVEPSSFLLGVKRGNFSLFSSRWVGVADGSLLLRTLGSKQNLNRVNYSSPEVDVWLKEAFETVNGARRTELLLRTQARMLEDLPYFPLWYWNVAAIVSKKLPEKIEPRFLSRSGAWYSLMEGLAADAKSPESKSPVPEISR